MRPIPSSCSLSICLSPSQALPPSIRFLLIFFLVSLHSGAQPGEAARARAGDAAASGLPGSSEQGHPILEGRAPAAAARMERVSVAEEGRSGAAATDTATHIGTSGARAVPFEGLFLSAWRLKLRFQCLHSNQNEKSIKFRFGSLLERIRKRKDTTFQ